MNGKIIFIIAFSLLLILISEAKAEYWETSKFCIAGWGYNISCFIQPIQFPLDCQNPKASLFMFLNNTFASCQRKIFYNSSYYFYYCPRYKSITTCLNQWGACCDCEAIQNGTYYLPYQPAESMGINCNTYCTVFCSGYDQILTGTVAVPQGSGITEAIADFCFVGGWNHTTASPFFLPGDYVYGNASYTYYNFTSSSFLFANLTLSCERTNISCPEQCLYSYENYKFAYWHYYNGRNIGGKCVYDLEECPYGCDGVKCAGVPTPSLPSCGNGVCESGETYVNCPSDCPTPTIPEAPIPGINVTAWIQAGWGWALPLVSPMFIYSMVIIFFAIISGFITMHPLIPVIIIILGVMLLSILGIYPTWLSIVFIVIAGAIVAYTVTKIMTGGK